MYRTPSYVREQTLVTIILLQRGILGHAAHLKLEESGKKIIAVVYWHAWQFWNCTPVITWQITFITRTPNFQEGQNTYKSLWMIYILEPYTLKVKFALFFIITNNLQTIMNFFFVLLPIIQEFSVWTPLCTKIVTNLMPITSSFQFASYFCFIYMKERHLSKFLVPLLLFSGLNGK